MKVRALGAFLVILALGFGVCDSQLLATSRCVDPAGTGGCYSSIQAAIDAATAGDTVLVLPGAYAENVSINKRILLWAQQGEPCATNITPATGNGIVFLAGSSELRVVGFTIEAPTGWGIYCNANVTAYISNCTIRNCAGDAIKFEAGNSFTTNCILESCRWAGFWANNGSHQLYGNIIRFNQYSGIDFGYYANNSFVDYNCVWQNALNYRSYARKGPNDLEQNPQLVSPDSCDYHLQSTSVCRDKGRPGVSLDCDGTRNDIGVYGGPYAYCGPGPVVTQLQLVPATVVKGETFKIQAKGVTR
jgi:hypothetical protein